MNSRCFPKLFRFFGRIAAVGLLVLSCVPLFAQQTPDVQYLYDNNGRLVRAIDSNGNVATYAYDAVGNLLSITRKTTADLRPPVIIGVNPGVANQGESVEIVLTGTDFFLGTLTTDNVGITLSNIRVRDAMVTATLTLAPDTRLGLTALTVTTSLGADSATLTVIGPLPNVVRISPARGAADGGTPVTLFGTGFTPDTTFTIGGQPATDLVFVDAGTMTAKTPAGQPGLQADVVATNLNGSGTFPNGFFYLAPFDIPGAISVEMGGTETLIVTLREAPATNTTVTLVSASPAIATLPSSVIMPAGDRWVGIPVTGVSEGVSFVTVAIGAATRATSVFVAPPVVGEIELYSAVVGTLVTPTIQGPTSAPVVGASVTPSLQVTSVLGSGDTKGLILPLVQPAPAGGLCASLSVSNPAVATVPSQVCLNEGEQTVSFDLTALASGEALLRVTAGTELFTIHLLVDKTPVIPDDGGRAAVIGTLVAPTSQGQTSAPIVGVEVK